ncbi:lysylphosphatidylglycerol synthase transmembrane domain-containing protein [Rhodopseudomonas palustris]|uniref:Flippase-like domain-containing protein n=1 Tax=Rhodopseudomonas palustris (strain BisB18) TaxID=316056 RepID=Q20YP0_RHOPB
MRKFAIQALKFLVSAGLLFLALRNVDFAALWARIGRGSIGWLALSIGIFLVQIGCSALRWRRISSYCAAPLSIGQALRFNMIGAFFNQTLPSSIGGDAVRLLLVSRTGAGWRAAAYSVFVDRAIGLIALAIIVIVSLPWSYQLIQDPHGRTGVTLIDLAALGGGIGFLAFGKIRWHRLKAWRPTHHIQACSVVANRVLFESAGGAWVALLSFVIHALTVTIVWCVARSIAAPVQFWELLLLIPPVTLVTMLPISIAGWGVRETAMMVAFGYAGLPLADGVNISLLFGAVTFFVGALGGVVWIFSHEKKANTAG